MPGAARAMDAALAASASRSRLSAGRTWMVISRDTSCVQPRDASAITATVPAVSAARKVMMATTVTSARPAMRSAGTSGMSRLSSRPAISRGIALPPNRGPAGAFAGAFAGALPFAGAGAETAATGSAVSALGVGGATVATTKSRSAIVGRASPVPVRLCQRTLSLMSSAARSASKKAGTLSGSAHTSIVWRTTFSTPPFFRPGLVASFV